MTRLVPVESLVEPSDLAPFLEIFEQRFGVVRSTFDPYLVYRANGQALWIVRRDLEVPMAPRPFTFGMPFFYYRMRFPRPTTAATLRWGPLADRNLADLETSQLQALVNFEDLPLEPDQAIAWSHGYTIVRFRGQVLGLAFGFVAPDGRPTLRALTPRYWRLRFDRQLAEAPADAESG